MLELELQLQWRYFELLRMRWRLEKGITASEVLPAAIDWLSFEIAEMQKAIKAQTP